MSDPVYIGYYTLDNALSMPNDARFLMYDPAGPGSYNITGALLKSQILASPVVTGQMTVPAGSVSAPSMSAAGDLNTGIYFPAADTVGIATAGVERARITSTGNILVGSPSDDLVSKLQVAGSIMLIGSETNFINCNQSYLMRSYNSAGPYPFNAYDHLIYNSKRDHVFVTRNATTATHTIQAILTAAGALLINATSDPGYTAKLHVAGGMSFDNVANANSRVLDWYEEGTFTATATGMTGIPTGTVKYTRIGNTVTLDLPGISGTSNATTFTLTGVPAALTPVAAKAFVVIIQDNGGAFVFGRGIMGTSAILGLYKDAAGTAFTATGTKSLAPISVSYTLQ